MLNFLQEHPGLAILIVVLFIGAILKRVFRRRSRPRARLLALD